MAGLKSNNGDTRFDTGPDTRNSVSKHNGGQSVNINHKGLSILPTIVNIPKHLSSAKANGHRSSKQIKLSKKLSNEIQELNLFSDVSTNNISSMHQSIYNSLARNYKIDYNKRSSNSLNARTAPR